MDFPKKQQQSLIPKYLLDYTTELQNSHPDPTEDWGGSGSTYEAGTGIDITENVISVDSSVAMKEDIPDVSYYYNKSEVDSIVSSIENDIPTNISELINDTGYITSEALDGYATEQYVQNQGYITGITSDMISSALGYIPGTSDFSGDYDDLTNKPTIPVVPTNVSAFTNDAGYITSSALPTNYVTTNTTQEITGNKSLTGAISYTAERFNSGKKFTFNGRNPIKMIAPSNSTTGFTLYNSNNNEKCYLQYNDSQNALYLGRYGLTGVQEMGFLSEVDNSSGYKVLIPNLTSQVPPAQNVNYMAISVNNTKADSSGNVSLTIPDAVSGTNDGTNWTSLTIGSDTYSLASGGGSGSIVSGTNDGTNWTTITIDGSTYDIPSSGGSGTTVIANPTLVGDEPNLTGIQVGSDKYKIPSGGGGSATPNLFLHNFRLAFATTSSVTSYIEATILTKSSTQILTIAELASQIAALQATAYNDSVIGVIYGQWYRSSAAGKKETILGFGLTGTAASPNLYMTVPNGNGPTTSISFHTTTNATQTINWVNALMAASGSEVAAECTDVVTPALV